MNTFLKITATAALLLAAIAPLDAQTTRSSTSSSRGTTSRSSTTVRAASSGAKTTTTGSSQSGRASVDRRETQVSNSNVTNKGLTTVRTTSERTTRTSSGTTARASSGTTTRTSSGTTTRTSGSSTSAAGTPSRSSQTATTTVRQSSGTTSQTARQSSGTTTTTSRTQTSGTTSGSVSRTSQTAGNTAVRSNSNVTARQATGRQENNDAYTDRGGNYRYGGANNMDIRGDGRDVMRVPPMDRPPIPYSSPAVFNSKKPHYYGYNIASMPYGYVKKVYWGRDYYSYNGIWYTYVNNVYRVCRPPYGISVRFGLCKKGLTSVRFSYYNSVYRTYSAIDQNYAIIAEQNRIIAENNAIIAAQNARLALNSTNANLAYLTASQLGLIQSYASATTNYYYQDGVFYTGHGRNFTTIVPPAGAIVASLPEDYIVVMYGGDPFYRVENTLYRQFVVDGAPYFEVLGQFPY